MTLLRLCCIAIVVASCAKPGAADQAKPAKPGAPDSPASKDPPMTDPKAPIHKAPPTPNSPPPEDTARYVAWMEKRGTPIKDKPREDTYLRIGDWGFFDHGGGPGVFLDGAALDRAGHAIVGETGDWHVLFTTSGLDAAEALKRVAWLLRAGPVDPTTRIKLNHQNKVTAPALTVAKDGTITFIGWMVFPPNMSNPMRVTISVAASGTKLVYEPANKL
jgi:hypothetical protein